MNWPVVKLGDVAEIRGGGTPDKSVAAFWGGSIPWASVKDFKDIALSGTIDNITQAGVPPSSRRRQRRCAA